MKPLILTVILSESTAVPVVWRWYERVGWVANLVLVVVAIGGIVVAVCTLKKIERQTRATEDSAKATKKSAEAALLNAQSLINAERSWLLVTIEQTTIDPWLFNLRATNQGKSPAEILWVFSHEVVLDFGEQLPDEPNYGPPDMIFSHRQWIPSGGFFDIEKLNMALHEPDNPATFAALRAGQEWLWNYGIVRYRDSLSHGVHETRFCYLVNFRTGPLMSGPPGYNDCT